MKKMKQLIFLFILALFSINKIYSQNLSMVQIIDETCDCILKIQNKTSVFNSTINDQRDDCVAKTLTKHNVFFKSTKNRENYFNSFHKIDSIEAFLLQKFKLERKAVFKNQLEKISLSDVVIDFETENDARKEYMFKEITIEGYLNQKYYGKGKYILEIVGEPGDNLEGDGVYGMATCFLDNAYVVSNLDEYNIYGDFHLINLKGDIIDLEYIISEEFVGDGFLEKKICNITIDNAIVTHIDGSKIKKKEKEVNAINNEDELKIWNKATKYNTISAYQSYLEMYPNGEFSFDAKELIHQLSRSNSSNNTKDVYLNQNKSNIDNKKGKKELKKENTKKVENQYEEKKKNVESSESSNKQSDNKNYSKDEDLKPELNVVEEDNVVYQFVSEKAEFIGGEDKMIDFISRNIKFPKKALRMNTQGRVFIKAIVEKDGNLSNIVLMKGLSDECNSEAIRIVKIMPKWKPAKLDGNIVRNAVIIPITFQII